jgi:hypothetical protein
VPARIGWASLHGHLQRTARSDESTAGEIDGYARLFGSLPHECGSRVGVLSLLLPPGRRHRPIVLWLGISSPKLIPTSRAVSIESQSSGTVFCRRVASASGT